MAQIGLILSHTSWYWANSALATSLSFSANTSYDKDMSKDALQLRIMFSSTSIYGPAANHDSPWIEVENTRWQYRQEKLGLIARCLLHLLEINESWKAQHKVKRSIIDNTAPKSTNHRECSNWEI